MRALAAPVLLTRPACCPCCPSTPQEPRRVGGPLPLMHANAPIHLRVVVDRSCVEVYTGTGEVSLPGNTWRL